MASWPAFLSALGLIGILLTVEILTRPIWPQWFKAALSYVLFLFMAIAWPLGRFITVLVYYVTQDIKQIQPNQMVQLVSANQLEILVGIILCLFVWSTRNLGVALLKWIRDLGAAQMGYCFSNIIKAVSTCWHPFYTLLTLVCSALLALLSGMGVFTVTLMVLEDRLLTVFFVTSQQSGMTLSDWWVSDMTWLIWDVNLLWPVVLAVLLALVTVVISFTGLVNRTLDFGGLTLTPRSDYRFTPLVNDQIAIDFNRYKAPFKFKSLDRVVVMPALLLGLSVFMGVAGVLIYLYTYDSSALNYLSTALIAYAKNVDLALLLSQSAESLRLVGADIWIALSFGFLAFLLSCIFLLGFWYEACGHWVRRGFESALPNWSMRWGAYYKAGLYSVV
jgi:hypothetical protein